MFESRISARATVKLPGWEKPHAQTVAWSYDMEGHAKKMRLAILWTGKQDSGATLQSLKPLLGWYHQFKQEELESVGELSEVCSQIVLKCK